MKNILNKRIKEMRLKNKLTLLEVANKLKVKEATIQRYESGEIKNIKHETILALSIIFGCSPSYLMGWEKSTTPSFNYYELPSDITLEIVTKINNKQDLPLVTIPDMILGKYARNQNVMIMHVDDDSMNKVLQNSTTIGILTHGYKETLHDGDMVIAIHDNNRSIVRRFFNDKKNERFILRPDSSNPAYTDTTIKYEDIDRKLVLIGKVVIYAVYL